MTAALEDLVQNIQVDAKSYSARVRQVRVQESNAHDLSQSLSASIYRVLHSGGPETSPDAMPSVDWNSATQLAAVTRSRLVHRVVPVARTSSGHGTPQNDAETVVLWQGVRIAVPRNRVVDRGPDFATVAFSDIRPAVSPGFFLLDRGLDLVKGSTDTFRIYVHMRDFESARKLWPRLTEGLDKTGCRYQAKVLSKPSSYPRRDAIVIYSRWPGGTDCVPAVVDAVRESEGIGSDVSEFALEVAPGVGLGWEPTDSRAEMKGLSLGQHRSTVISRALVEASTIGADPLEHLRKAMRDGNICPDSLYRNADSPPEPGGLHALENGAGCATLPAHPV